MRIRDLFTIPTGQKVTEKYLQRVLAVSICSILLCMSCLVGTTWAWYTVGIENVGNEIVIGKPAVTLWLVGSDNAETEIASGKAFETGEYRVRIEHANNEDDLHKKSTLYVTFTFGEDAPVYITLNEPDYEAEITISNKTSNPCTVRCEVSWFAPVNAIMLIGDALVAEEPTEPSTEATTEATTEPSTEATTEVTTEPSTEATTEATTEPSTEATTEATTEPSTEATTEATTEPSTESTTEATTEPSTEATTEATTASTEETNSTTEDES